MAHQRLRSSLMEWVETCSLGGRGQEQAFRYAGCAMELTSQFHLLAYQTVFHVCNASMERKLLRRNLWKSFPNANHSSTIG